MLQPITSLIVLATLGLQAGVAISAEYTWEASALMEVTTGKAIVWEDYSTQPIEAPTEQEALAAARTEAEKKAQAAYPAAKMKPGSLEVRVQLRSVDAVPVGSNECLVKMYLACEFTVEYDRPSVTIAGLPVASNREFYDKFNVRLQVSDGTNAPTTLTGQVTTIGRGGPGSRIGGKSFDVWRGNVESYEQKELTISVEQEEPWENEVSNRPNPWASVGKFKVTLRYVDGKFSPVWQPLATSKEIVAATAGPTSVARLSLTGREVRYRATVTALHPAQAQQASAQAKADRARADAEFTLKLNSDPEVKPFTGVVEFKGTNAAGTSTMGFGLTILVCENEAKAREFATKTFPGRNDVRFAPTEAAAKKLLEDEFQTRKQGFYSMYTIDASTVRVILTPKQSRTNLDNIMQPGRPPRRRPR